MTLRWSWNSQMRMNRSSMMRLSYRSVSTTNGFLFRYKIGEAFFHISLKRAQTLLQKDQESIDSDINGLQGKIDQYQQEMKDLKVALYAKFGKQINLD